MDQNQTIAEKGYCVIDLTPERHVVGRIISAKYTIVALITSGSVEYEMNMETVCASAGMRIVFPHVSMLNTLSMSDDFKAMVLVINDSFAFESIVGIGTEKIRTVFSRSNRVVDDKQEWDMLLNLMEGLNQYQSFPGNKYSQQLSGALFRNMMILLCDTECTDANGRARFVYSVTDNYFRDFVNLLNDYVRTEHEVAFYADKLNITAKYLGEICKQKSGRKAKEIISSVLLSQLKREIMMSGKSMKVIAFDFGFSDQSSLGKFFRKMTGLSPIVFRKQCAGLK
ncbi:MAG: AraC family transcriptional regulator [Bacteroidales bacterium]|nr:AraC family transcriptional regulator [Candidatus Sodaliphilus limicaballi]